LRDRQRFRARLLSAETGNLGAERQTSAFRPQQQ
jgi:hypothetical protein